MTKIRRIDGFLVLSNLSGEKLFQIYFFMVSQTSQVLLTAILIQHMIQLSTI